MSLPIIAPDSSLKIFKFYQDCAICEATIHRGVILKLVKSFPLTSSREAFQFACLLSQSYTTLLSPSIKSYKVWVDVRCSTVASLPKTRLKM
jgi:hypothetical protein